MKVTKTTYNRYGETTSQEVIEVVEGSHHWKDVKNLQVQHAHYKPLPNGGLLQLVREA